MSASKKPTVSRLKVWLLLALWIGGMCIIATPSAMALAIIRQHIQPSKSFKFDGLQVKAGSVPNTTSNAHEDTGKIETSCLPHPQPHPSSLPGRAQKASPQ